jgi:hypothetical protein
MKASSKYGLALWQSKKFEQAIKEYQNSFITSLKKSGTQVFKNQKEAIRKN